MISPDLCAIVKASVGQTGFPGMCNLTNDIVRVDGVPSQDVIERYTRSPGQCNNDGFKVALCALPESGKPFQHNELSASIIVNTTLNELEVAPGKVLSGWGAILLMFDVIQLSATSGIIWRFSISATLWSCIPRSWCLRRYSELFCKTRVVTDRFRDAQCLATNARCIMQPTMPDSAPSRSRT
uniref:DUF222 domain-containing protein n=1 Tax=Mycobacterium leprae TaxID=1769 RepID=Q797T9_MYCLR|nr:hypothetical protein MLCB1779.12c [imported] - Mycobacterium leprae [Mycobacterium leprae]CAB10993.1 hypothetical protein MLCB1779.12c [Mycobacterium leprae]